MAARRRRSVGRRCEIGSLRAAGVAALLAVYALSARAAPAVTVEAVRRGPAVEVTARARLRASPALVWQTLTDYDHLWRFVPGLGRSRVLARHGATAIVEERGAALFAGFPYPIDVVLASTEHPPYVIASRVVRGDLRRLDGRYRIVPAGDGTVVLQWTGFVEPDFWLPPYVGTALIRASVADQLGGIVREIGRRRRLAR